uniref:TFIIB-type zinc ribbon-containing protein n=1 Tax=candidate division WWE3 bacterium TaxID=2053526 RepID=A0A7C4TPT6_UNCKA
MSARICPNCKSILNDYDHFFCSVCATKLPKELILPVPPVKIKNYKLSSATKSSIPDALGIFKSIRTYYIFVLVIFIGFVGLGISKTGVYEFARYEFNKKSANVDLPVITEKKSRTIKMPEVVMKRGEFKTVKFSEILPFETLIYFEGNDIETLAKYLAKDPSLTSLLRNPSILLENNFVGFNYEGNWGFILVPKDPSLVQEFMEGVESEYWYFDMVKGMFVLVPSAQTLDKTLDIEEGLVSGLALNSEFVKKDQELAKEGKLKAILMKEDALNTLKNSLGGLEQATIAHINKIIGEGFDSIVVD